MKISKIWDAGEVRWRLTISHANTQKDTDIDSTSRRSNNFRLNSSAIKHYGYLYYHIVLRSWNICWNGRRVARVTLLKSRLRRTCTLLANSSRERRAVICGGNIPRRLLQLSTVYSVVIFLGHRLRTRGSQTDNFGKRQPKYK